MKYLGIRTDSPTAELYFYEDQKLLGKLEWRADRQLARDLLRRLEAFLADNDSSFAELKGLFIFRGPGSFTGLRIGITVVNTAAYALEIPVVGGDGEDWQTQCLKRLKKGHDDEVVLPHYGAEARITKPRK